MPPRTLLLSRSQCVRMVPMRPLRPMHPPFLPRTYTSTSPRIPHAKGSNQDELPHVTEEAAEISKATGETPPRIGQGTSISEAIKRNPQALKKAPSVLKKDATPGSKREYSTYALSPEKDNVVDAVDINGMPSADVGQVVDEVDIAESLPEGAKFPLPDLPLPPTSNLRHRYSPIVQQVTSLLMRDGKKATAQSVMTEVLAILRTKSAPKLNLRTPIIPSAPPLESLPSDPIAYLQTAIDSIAPLMRIRSAKGSGGFRESIPSPLALKQRRRSAVMWIIDAADKKRARMSLAERFAEEIVAVVEGRSTAWEKRQQVHKTAVASRANVRVKVM